MSGGKEINVIALVKGEEQYLFFFDDNNRTETLRMLGRYAANPELNFSWYDAAILSEKIREALPANGPKSSPKSSFANSEPKQSNAAVSAPRFRLPTRGET